MTLLKTTSIHIGDSRSEVNIDYPEYDDVEDATTEFYLNSLRILKKKLIDCLKQVLKVR